MKIHMIVIIIQEQDDSLLLLFIIIYCHILKASECGSFQKMYNRFFQREVKLSHNTFNYNIKPI